MVFPMQYVTNTAFLLFTVCSAFLSSLALYNMTRTSSLVTPLAHLKFSIVLQHHISKPSR